jgi:Dual specificity phosphatase, catalytic domain
VAGVQYFTCAPSYGELIRANRALRISTDAKYPPSDAPNDPNPVDDCSLSALPQPQILIQHTPHISYIAPNLFLGSYTGACSTTYLRALGITHILTAASELLPPSDPDPRNPLAILHVRIADLPWANLIDCLDTCLLYIDRVLALSRNSPLSTATATAATNTNANPSPPRLLVHCAYGASRSASIILAWFLRSQHHQHIDAAPSYDTAFKHLRTLRPGVRPNIGFNKQLKAWFASGCDTKAHLGTLEAAARSPSGEDNILGNGERGVPWRLWTTLREAKKIHITRNDVLKKQGLLEDLDWSVLDPDP